MCIVASPPDRENGSIVNIYNTVMRGQEFIPSSIQSVDITWVDENTSRYVGYLVKNNGVLNNWNQIWYS